MKTPLFLLLTLNLAAHAARANEIALEQNGIESAE